MTKILLHPTPLRKFVPASTRTAGGDATRGLQTKRCEYSTTKRLLQCRLAWYGFRSVSLGSFRDLSERTTSVDLFRNDGSFLGQVEVDRQSGRVDVSSARALTQLLSVAGWGLTQ